MPSIRLPRTAVVLALAACAASAQAPPPALAFEVASIRSTTMPTPNQIASGQAHFGMNVDAARVDIGSQSLAELIRIAYEVKPYQVQGPDWIASERFDVAAKLPAGATKEQVPRMLQALLADRFGLKVHRESKEQSVYAMVVGKNGLKIKESAPDADAPTGEAPPAGGMVIGAGENQMRLSGKLDDPKGMAISGGPIGNGHLSVVDGAMRLDISRITMAALADFVGRFVDRPVVDMTEVKGEYQVALPLSTQDLIAAARTAGVDVSARRGGRGEAARQPGDAASDPTGGSMFAAVQQLGLKLESRKAPIDLIVVDQAQKTPTDN